MPANNKLSYNEVSRILESDSTFNENMAALIKQRLPPDRFAMHRAWWVRASKRRYAQAIRRINRSTTKATSDAVSDQQMRKTTELLAA